MITTPEGGAGAQPGKIYELMGKVMGELDAIEKDRRNQQGSGYNFRGIDDVYNAMHPVLSKHGIFPVPSVLDRVREERKSSTGGVLIYTMLTVEYRFFAPDGSFVRAVTVGEAFDSGDKSSNKAMSAAQKYAILQTFCVPTIGDNDTENTSPQVAPRDAAPPPVQPRQNQTRSAGKAGSAKSGGAATGNKGQSTAGDPATEAQIRALFAILKKEFGLEGDAATEELHHRAAVESVTQITKGRASDLIKSLNTEVAEANR